MTAKRVIFALFFFFLLIPERGEGREKERGRNIDVRGKHRSLASCMSPHWGPNSQPRAYALTGNRTCDLLLCGMTPNQLIHSGQGIFAFLKSNIHIFKSQIIQDFQQMKGAAPTCLSLLLRGNHMSFFEQILLADIFNFLHTTFAWLFL